MECTCKTDLERKFLASVVLLELDTLESLIVSVGSVFDVGSVLVWVVVNEETLLVLVVLVSDLNKMISCLIDR